MTYVTYSSSGGPFGPWTNGGPPGISASVLTAMEAFMNAGWFDSSITSNHSGVMTSLGQIVNGAVQPNPSSTSINGSTSGTATLYQPFTGTFKLVFCVLSSFRNGGGSTQTIAFPTAFTTASYIISGDINSMQLLSSASAQAINIITTLSSSGGSAVSNSTAFGAYSFGVCNHPADTLSFNSGNASTHTGVLLIAGI